MKYLLPFFAKFLLAKIRRESANRRRRTGFSPCVRFVSNPLIKTKPSLFFPVTIFTTQLVFTNGSGKNYAARCAALRLNLLLKGEEYVLRTSHKARCCYALRAFRVVHLVARAQSPILFSGSFLTEATRSVKAVKSRKTSGISLCRSGSASDHSGKSSSSWRGWNLRDRGV